MEEADIIALKQNIQNIRKILCKGRENCAQLIKDDEYKNWIASQAEEIAKQKEELAAQKAALANKDAENEKLKEEIERLKLLIAQKQG
mgnify:CR=1 FL=1